jgi:CRP-like cAMP-binding protein
MDKYLLELKNYLFAINPLKEEEWKAFRDAWEPFSVRRKTSITEEGQTEKYLYFITAGVQRVYYLDEREREATIVFTYSNSFGGVLDSMLTERASRYYYESLTESSFLRIPYTMSKTLANQHPGIQLLVTKALSITISGLLERQVELQCYSSEDRFRSLLNRSPHILQMIPHKYIANYLGIDPTNFSKLLNRVQF